MPLLLRATGAGWKLEIVGKLPELPPFISPVPDSTIDFTGTALESLLVCDLKTGAMLPVTPEVPVAPLFYEAVSYDIYFDRTDPTASVSLPPGASPRRVLAEGEHHNINFGNNVGFVEIVVSGTSGQAKLRLEVFSRKIDYRSDYLAMRNEVSGMLRNLAMAANAKTFGLAAPARDHNPTLVEWFALLHSHFDEFIKLAGSIYKNPHSELVHRAVPVDTERARNVSRQSIERALRRNNGGAVIPPLGAALPRRIKESVASPTYDTRENRYFKALIKATYRNLRALSATFSPEHEDADHESESKFFDSIRPELKAMERRIEMVLRTPFMTQVADATLARPDSMVFHKHLQYARFDKLCRLLNGGLSFTGNIVPIGIKETSLLYEYWCFLKIVVILRERFDLVEQSVIKFQRMRTTVALAKGTPSAMKFVHAVTGKPLYVVYNRLFSRLPTIAQKPDNVIQFASQDKFYIFDAKYKIQYDHDYVALYGGPGPTTDDVNTMHRYRDAIAIPHPLKPNEYCQGVVSGAVVLFPYPNEEAYRGHKFYKSIAQVEIGGLPFLPNSTVLMAEKIGNLLMLDYPEAVPLAT